MPEENQNDEDNRDDDFDHGKPCAGDGPANQFGSVVDRHDRHAAGQAGFDFLKAGLHAVDDVKSIAAFAHDYDAGDGFACAVEVGGTAADIGA